MKDFEFAIDCAFKIRGTVNGKVQYETHDKSHTFTIKLQMVTQTDCLAHSNIINI